MSIGFSFRNVINSRSAGSSALQYNEQATIVDIGGGTAGFISIWPPLDVASPDYRRITIRTTPDDDTTKLTEVLALPVSTNEFYCDYVTGTVTVDSALMGLDVYATYNGPNNPITDTLTVPVAAVDDLCRVILTEIPLEFNLLPNPDPRSIAVTSSVHGALTETKDVNDVRTDNTKFYVEFEIGRITVHPDLEAETLTVSYYGSGSIILANDVNELHTAFEALDAAVVHTDGSTAMTNDLDMDGFNITDLGASGLVDGIHVSTHDHEGTLHMGVQLSGQNAFIANSFISTVLNDKTVSGIGAVATGNIQNAAVTNVELDSDKDSLNKVSGAMLVIGGASGTTVGINCTPSVSCSAEFEFNTLLSSVDKVVFHRSGGTDGDSGINIDASQNLNIFTLKDTKISFRDSSAAGTEHAYIDTLTGDLVLPNNGLASKVNTTSGKLCEGGIPLFPSGTTTIFYNVSAPLGWTQITESSPGVSIDDTALRIVTGSGGWGDTGGIYGNASGSGFSVWMTHRHDETHSHYLLTGTVSGDPEPSTISWGGNTLWDASGYVHTHTIMSGTLSGTSYGVNGTYTSVPTTVFTYVDVVVGRKT